MSEFLTVMGLATLPAVANFVGGALAEVFRIFVRALSLALHLAAGIVLAADNLELVPEAVRAQPVWVPLLAFVAGGAVFVGLDRDVPPHDAPVARAAVAGEMTAASRRALRWSRGLAQEARLRRPSPPRAGSVRAKGDAAKRSVGPGRPCYASR